MQIDHFNLDTLVRNTERENFSESRCSHCGVSQPTEKYFKQHRNDEGHNKSPLNSSNSNNKRTERND